MEQVQKNAIGVAVIGTITEDGLFQNVATVSTKTLVFRKPDVACTVVSKTATFVTDGTDGKIQYITEALFLDTVGVWECQGYVVFPGGFDGRSDIQFFEVKDNL
jgi:hypothetical protein